MPDRVLILGPGCAEELAGGLVSIGQWLKEGGRLLALGLDSMEMQAVLPGRVEMKKGEHRLAVYFESPSLSSAFAGVCPADLHNRDPRQFPLIGRRSHDPRRRRPGSIGQHRLLPDGPLAFRSQETE